MEEKLFYPFCKVLDINKHYDLKKQSPLQLYFETKRVNASLSLFVGERNRQVKRTIKYLQSSYEGNEMKIGNLSNPNFNGADN